MENIVKITECQGRDAFRYIGYNLLQDITPTIVDANGTKPVMKNWSGKEDPDADLLLTNPYTGDSAEHIDIFSNNFTIMYDLGTMTDIDGILVSGFWANNDTSGVYMLGQYGIYMAETLDVLFADESLLIEVDNTEICLPNTSRQSETYFQCANARGRYFGVKVTKGCITDDITRISRFGVYNHKITEQKEFLHSIVDDSFLRETDIILPEDAKGNIMSLINGSVFDKQDAVELGRGEVVLTASQPADYLLVVGLLQQVSVFTDDSLDDLWKNEANVEVSFCDTQGNPERCYLCRLTEVKQYIGIRTEEGAVLEQLGLYTGLRVANVDMERVRTQDFIGIGVNDIPTVWMSESWRSGFRTPYWPVYCYRLAKSKPSVVRVWFQIDWVVTEEDDYKLGRCNFHSDGFRGFLKHMDAYEEAEIEVELNFGWKHAKSIQDWFSIPSLKDKRVGSGRAASAPKEFEGFAKCCAETIRFLCEEKKYTCLKYLTFYNEPNFGDWSPAYGDFAGYYGKSKEMWEVMLRTVDRELKTKGLNQYVDYWIAEEAGRSDEMLQWIEYMTKRCGDLNSLNSFHLYNMNYDTRLDFFEKILERAGEPGAAATEFAIYSEPRWVRSNIEYVMSMLHSGVRGGMYWILQSSHLPDPSFAYLRGEERSYWFCAPFDKESTRTENYPYHEFSLFTHYLPCHSKVLETTIYDDDIRVETIKTPDGNYTVFVESNCVINDKHLEIHFSENISKPFRKHVYKESEVTLDGNMYIPKVCKEIMVEDVLEDWIGNEYQLICYTTLPAYKQIILNKTFVEIKTDESFQFYAELIDCEGEVIWEIVSSSGTPAVIDSNGVFSLLDTDMDRAGDLHCVRVALKDDPTVYAIAMVEIILEEKGK